MDEFLIEMQDSFLQEAADLLNRVEALSLALEKNPKSQETFAELARLAHNFKGSGKAVGFEHISKLGHKLEDFILAIKNGIVDSTPEQLDFLFKCLDRLKQDIQSLTLDKTLDLNHTELFQEIDTRLEYSKIINSQLVSEEIISEKPNLETAIEEVKNSLEPTVKLEDSVVDKKETTVHVATHSPQPVEVLRIQKPKIDFLLEAFGEQVILQSTLEQFKFDLENNKDLVIKTITQLTKLTFELQSHAMSLTMVQLGPLFTKLERATRDAARMCGKIVDVQFFGAETEVDKTLVDSLSDPLTHMVRNAVDHAIEDKDDRLKLNKNEIGLVQIKALRVGGQIWIEVHDDGKGLDPQKIKNKAIEKKIITEVQAAKLSDGECFQLIFANGFSTKDQVSEVSGRGVGMNVVQETVQHLKGNIEIDSTVNKGTCFRLKLPLSLAIFNGAVVRVHDNRFVVPSSEIAEIGRISLDQQVQLSDKKAAIKIRDEIFQLIDLRLKLKHGLKVETKTEVKKELPLLISRKIGNKAFVVDEILGIQKIVQKQLGEEIKRHPEFAAGTILSDGSPGVILNLQFMAESA